MNSKIIAKPFLKWVGGKTQIIEKIISKIPCEMNNYHELFLGGGSVLFAVLSLQKHGKIIIKNKIYAYDINERLIQVYKHVQKNKDELYEFINDYTNEYKNIEGKTFIKISKSLEDAKTSKQSYYYWLRKKYNTINTQTIESSALFILLNKICFRGLYREGPNGFNVPYGNYKKVNIITKDYLNYISNLIKDVEFISCDFTQSIKNVKEGDFVYIDPPYVKKDNNSFVGYVHDGFNLEMHTKLFESIKNLGTIKFVMNNSDENLVINTFKEFLCENITAKRAINSKNPGSKTSEVIIYN